jgi:hypothetical protein
MLEAHRKFFLYLRCGECSVHFTLCVYEQKQKGCWWHALPALNRLSCDGTRFRAWCLQQRLGICCSVGALITHPSQSSFFSCHFDGWYVAKIFSQKVLRKRQQNLCWWLVLAPATSPTGDFFLEALGKGQRRYATLKNPRTWDNQTRLP